MSHSILTAAVFTSLCLTPNTFAALSAPQIVTGINESQRIVLYGNTRPEARAEFDRGAVADSFPLNGMQLLLKRSAEREQAAEALAESLHKAGSPHFHQWLTAEQFAEQFGVALEDIATISAWLRSHGFTVLAPSPSRMTINFSGTARQVREAFGTEIHALDVRGVRHIANMSNPSIPAALAPAIEGVVSLHDFRPRPMAVPKAQYTFTFEGASLQALVPADLATIYHFKSLFSAGITGQGQTIALIEDTDVYDPEDWNTFRTAFGLAKYSGATFTTVHPGGCADPGANGDDFEAILDVEWASAAAPNANLQLISCASTNTVWGALPAVQNLVNQRKVPPIISFSYGYCEVQSGAAFNAALRVAYQQAVLEGVSISVAAGDNGADLCSIGTTDPAQDGVTVNALASTIYDVAVGGTDFGDTYAGTVANYWSNNNSPTYESAFSYVPEIPWDDTCASTLISNYLGYATPYGPNGFCAVAGGYFLGPYAGSGGPSNCATGESLAGIIPPNGPVVGPTPANGTCQGWKKPAWQFVLGNPNDGVRDVPDVSMFAADGIWNHFFVFCNSDPATGVGCVGVPSNWGGGGGTSFATPIVAGMQALVNQVWGGRQGNPAPIYYALANLQYGTQGNKSCESFATGGPSPFCIFNDITVGDNDVPCIGPNNCYAPPGGANTIGVLSLSDNSYQPTYKAGIGWDFATGLGSVNATNLVLNPIWLFGAP
jgi:subtilase family serine protease